MGATSGSLLHYLAAAYNQDVYVSRLDLSNFRNYAALELELPSGFIALQGSNAQGKTNLLEALYLLATTRSPRARRDAELLRWDTEERPVVTRLAAQAVFATDKAGLEIIMMGQPEQAQRQTTAAQEDYERSPSSSGVQRRLRLNGVAKRAADFIGTLRAALFRPEDMELLTGPPAGRRRALDILLSQTEPRYVRALQRYSRVLVQRNHLLRRIGGGQAAPVELEPWNETLLAEGVYLMERRHRALERLSTVAADAHYPLSSGTEHLRMAYQSTAPVAEGAATDTASLTASFRGRLEESLRREIALGQTTVGPHRDDIDLLINGAPAGTYGSRGQQRTIGLAWKLAEASYLREVTGEHPLVLLDDVFSELDAARRRCVLDVVRECQQVVLTTTDGALTGEAPELAARFEITGGRLQRL